MSGVLENDALSDFIPFIMMQGVAWPIFIAARALFVSSNLYEKNSKLSAAHAFVITMILSYGGGIFTQFMLGRFPFGVFRDSIIMIGGASFFLIRWTPGLHKLITGRGIFGFNPIRLVFCICAELTRANNVLNVTKLTNSTFHASPLLGFPFLNVIIFGGMAASGGGYVLHGLSPIHKGIHAAFVEGALGATVHQLLTHRQTVTALLGLHTPMLDTIEISEQTIGIATILVTAAFGVMRDLATHSSSKSVPIQKKVVPKKDPAPTTGDVTSSKKKNKKKNNDNKKNQ